MTRLIQTMALIALVVFPADSRKLDDLQIHAILSCIQQKGPEVGSPVPLFDSLNIRFRYHAGQFPFRYPTGETVQVDRENEVRFAAYGPDENSLIIYDIFLSQKNGDLEVQSGNPASYVKRNNKLVSGDNPGGQATDLYLRKLVKEFSLKKPGTMPLKELSSIPQGVSCLR